MNFELNHAAIPHPVELLNVRYVKIILYFNVQYFSVFLIIILGTWLLAAPNPTRPISPEVAWTTSSSTCVEKYYLGIGLISR